MENAASTSPSSGAPASFPACPGCGKGVDPLRAGHVAILEGRFVYFCNAECKQARLRGAPSTLAPEEVETAAPPPVAMIEAVVSSGVKAKTNGNGAGAHSTPTFPPVTTRTPAPPPVVEPAPASAPAAAPAPTLASAPARADDSPRTLRSAAVAVESRRASIAPPPRAEHPAARAALFVGAAAGALVPCVGLIDSIAATARLPLVFVAALSVAVRAIAHRRDPADPHPLVTFAPALFACGAAVWARAAHDAHASSVAVLAGLAAATVLAIEAMVDRARVKLNAERERIARALDVKVRVLYGDEPVAIDARDVKPGETVVVEAGEMVGVDAIVAAGQATVTPWLGAPHDVSKREGDAVVAGARVVSGRLRLTTTWSGLDRAWTKLALAPSLRVDVAAPLARLVRTTIERGAPIAAALVAVAAFAANASPIEIAAAACAAAAAFGAKGTSAIVSLHYARAQLAALASGVIYKDARAFERAQSADAAVLCARGTVLMGEPEIVAIEPLGSGGDVGRVLSLAAGAEAASTHPFASAILRAARTRGVRADNVRNALMHPGLGVSGLASNGERLVVGGRALMMQEKISVALADARVTELEAQGRSVLLVAVADKLVGLLALQDGMRAGARAAVQRLLDARIEPILLSGEARETCESIGRALDIEHVRPEVLPTDRGADVKSLADSGHVVAVIGHATSDDGALGAADIAVAMGAAGQTPGEWAVALASDDVRDAALALTIPHATRDKARTSITIGVVATVIALLAVALGVAPLGTAPLCALIGTLALAAHAEKE